MRSGPDVGASIETTGQDAAQEFQLETRHLVFLMALVVVLCVASFMLGRWVERRSHGPSLSSAASTGRAEGKVEEGGDVAGELTFFDTLKGEAGAPLQPAAAGSGLPAAGAGSRPPAAAAAPGRRSVNEGVMVQVFASKDRASAEAVRRRLRARGYTALLVTDRGQHKIRVGPYADRAEAERAAAVLREQESLTTWIP